MPVYLDEARPRFDDEQPALAGAGQEHDRGTAQGPLLASRSRTRRLAAVVATLGISAAVIVANAVTNTTDPRERASVRLAAESVDRSTPTSRPTPSSPSWVRVEPLTTNDRVAPEASDGSDPSASGSPRPEPDAGPDDGSAIVDTGASSQHGDGVEPPGTAVLTAPRRVVPQETVPTPSLSAPRSTPSTMPGSASTAVPSTTVPSSIVPPTAVPGGAGAVIWQDDFDRLDTSRWALEHSTYGDGNNELQCYRPENVSVAGGRLVLRAIAETYTCPNGSTRQVTSGMVRSRGIRFEPGQAIEFRVKLTPADPANQGGLWPAVWSSGWAGGGWPRGGEVDYLEVMTATDPTRSIYSIHYAKPGGSHGVTNRPIFGRDNFSAAWHTVRFDYGLNGELTWHLDGRQVHRVNGVQTAQGYPAPFDRAIGEIKMNLALGGRPGPLDPRALGSTGATFEIDYIRVVRL